MSPVPGSRPRRVALVDLDWADLDALPSLLQAETVAVTLVASRGTRDPGARVAELCGLPRSLELSDLVRTMVDEAVVGGGGPRREGIERLLRALGAEVKAASPSREDVA